MRFMTPGVLNQDKIPLVKINIKIESPKNPIHLFKKVFLPIPHGKLPLIKMPESFFKLMSSYKRKILD